jgi:CheY-like chemotaxis protein
MKKIVHLQKINGDEPIGSCDSILETSAAGDYVTRLFQRKNLSAQKIEGLKRLVGKINTDRKIRHRFLEFHKVFRKIDDSHFEYDETGKSAGANQAKYPGIRRILLAEDDEDDSDFFVRSLSTLSASYTLTIVEDGGDLMTKLASSSYELPDIIFLDLNMPRKNGADCMKAIRANDRLKDLPVVVISTASEPETVDYLFNLGANAYIKKPTNVDDWATLIGKVLAMKWSGQLRREEFMLSVGKK